VLSGEVLIVAPLGASCVLLFGYPRSPLAQPRNVVLGNALGGLVGIALAGLWGQGPLVLALSVALTILLGQQLRCLHPPAGGMAFLVTFLGVSWHFLLFPVVTIQGSGRAAARVHACSPMAERAKKQCCLCCGTQGSGSSDGITPPR
jgi:hypothetical protein